MSEGAVRDDMKLKMATERACGSKMSERSRNFDENFHTPDFGLTPIFDLLYFTVNNFGMWCLACVLLWFTSCTAGGISHQLFPSPIWMKIEGKQQIGFRS